MYLYIYITDRMHPHNGGSELTGFWLRWWETARAFFHEVLLLLDRRNLGDYRASQPTASGTKAYLRSTVCVYIYRERERVRFFYSYVYIYKHVLFVFKHLFNSFLYLLHITYYCVCRIFHSLAAYISVHGDILKTLEGGGLSSLC